MRLPSWVRLRPDASMQDIWTHLVAIGCLALLVLVLLVAGLVWLL